MWAAQRMGIYYTLVNWHLTSGEIAYIVGDCGARLFFADAELAAAMPDLPVDFTVGSEAGARPLSSLRKSPTPSNSGVPRSRPSRS